MQDGGESALLYPTKMASSADDPMCMGHMRNLQTMPQQGGNYNFPQRLAMYADAGLDDDVDDDEEDDNGAGDENQERQQTMTAHNKKKRRTAADKRRQWSADDDLAILQFVRGCGTKRWSKIQQLLPGRTPKQCRTRYGFCSSPGWTMDTYLSI